MPGTQEINSVKEALDDVASMLEEMRSILSMMSEDQALWTPSAKDVWPIQRSVTHLVNCEHRAAAELKRAIEGHPTPQTNAADTGIFAWFGPTPYALARLSQELRDQVEDLSKTVDSSHMSLETVRYPRHPPRKLLNYVESMRGHTKAHLTAIKKRLPQMPRGKEWDIETRDVYPDFAEVHDAYPEFADGD